MRKHKKNAQGITLIALIITIVVLLILAGVTINMVIGENGVVNKAQDANIQHTIAKENEKIQMAIVSARADDEKGYVKLTFSRLKSAIDKDFGTGKIEITDNSNGVFTLYSKDSNQTYVIVSDGSVLDENNIYKISTKEELIDFRDEVNNGNSYSGKCVILQNNITLTDSWTPIGTSTMFQGIFLGNGFTVSNVNVDVNNNAGFFGMVSNAVIDGLTINGNIQASMDEAERRAGGIVGYAIETQISNCVNNANVSASTHVGGIVGVAKNTNIIDNCINNGIVTSEKFSAGGVIGSLTSPAGITTVVNCGNTGRMVSEGSNSICGGIVATCMRDAMGLNIYNSYNIGNIDSGIYAGGILGMWDSISRSCEVANCYSIGDLNGNHCGGLIHSTHFYKTGPVHPKNLYWSSNTDCSAYSWISGNGNYPDLAKSNENDLKSTTFVQTLNNNREEDSWREWELNSNNFPVIKQ